MEAQPDKLDGDSPNGDHQPPRDGDDTADPSSRKAAVRKRTKTGCLTCRKRRIKCDEGRPTCNNCIKSKRQCEGYNQRVVFKEPLGMYAGLPMGSLQYHARPPHVIMHQEQQQQLPAQRRLSTQPLLAPKPSLGGPAPPALHPHQHMYPPDGGSALPAPTVYDGSQPPLTNSQDHTYMPDLGQDTFRAYPQDQWVGAASVGMPSAAGISDASPEQAFRNPPMNEGIARPHVESDEILLERRQDYIGSEQLQEWEFEDYRQDESMDESDEGTSAAGQMIQLRGQQAGIFVAHMHRNPRDPLGTQPRNFEAFPGNSMATYDPEPSQSPLNDEQIRAVFSHFIRVTGPSISLYERHSHDAGIIIDGRQLARSQRHIWASTFPVLSFSHPALLQAILAIASLQIARLEGNQPTASLKHYHLALRRIARNVGRPARRAQPANLAATLLLAYWEVWNSDHEKWCRHLLGARWIMKDIPFLSMSKAVLARRIEERYAREQMRTKAQMNGFADFIDEGDPIYLYRDWDKIDAPLLGVISGQAVPYADHGFDSWDENFRPHPRQPVTNKDVETYETLSDLYWWYCKMDTYQSILGGQKLFMDYNKWMACPPRAPIGRLDAVYGTFDHLMLLLARMSNFNTRDQARKKVALSRSPHGPKAPPPGTFPGLVPASGNVPLPAGFSPPRETTPEDQASQSELDFDAQTAAAHQEWGSIRHAFEVFKNALGPDFAPLDADAFMPLDTPFGPSRHYRTFSVAGIWLNYYMGLIMLYRAHPTMPPIAMMAAGLQAPNTAEWAMEIGRIAVGVVEDTSGSTVLSTLEAAGLIESGIPLFVAAVQYRDDNQRRWLIRRLHDTSRLTGWQSARRIAMGCESAWTRAFELKRGPPYVRDPDLDSVSLFHFNGPRTLDLRIAEIDSESADSIQERKGKIKNVEGPGLAMGLLLVEQDFEKLELGNRQQSS
ncbi:uncharacterized protein B0I36DRAFT_362728 [Microdochium trichocladiopsis]|uniref:Zn(2)-C6 fungal-type domain-containing protein n=1 Tax=Microdochium trichocladiopsis TaxID=1682393 RepID=A0A9P8Y8I7_9PEZI|nr:uncharacterized protein B0I36DRAFT_362728 [Microdochium trichocladiopsis]KAH7030936.1 hypothetical protein B0I36DRAFT_362728 [Microdochium trichocladiopsis]